MASTLNPRLASVTARDGFDTRNKDLNVACNEKQELASMLSMDGWGEWASSLENTSANVDCSVVSNDDGPLADDDDDLIAAMPDAEQSEAEASFNKWVAAQPVSTMEILEPTEYTAVSWVKSAWDNWVAAASASQVDTGAGIYDPVSAENSYWVELMDILWKARRDLDMTWDSHELAVCYCEFSRELISARHAFNEGIEDAKCSDYDSDTVECVKQTLELAVDCVWVEWENVKCQDKKCKKVATTCFLHMSGRKKWLCDACFSFVGHEE